MKINDPSGQSLGTILLENIQFGDNEHTTNLNIAEYGSNLFVETYNFTKDVIRKERFVIMDNTTIPEYSLKGCKILYKDNSNYYYTLSSLYDDTGYKYISSDGNDDNIEGAVMEPYLTIHYACTHLGEKKTLIITSDLEAETSQTILNDSIIIESYNEGNNIELKVKQLSTPSSVLFLIRNTENTLADVTFSHITFSLLYSHTSTKSNDETITAIDANVISVLEGNLDVKSCAFKRGGIESGVSDNDDLINSVISIEGECSVIFDGCSFEGLSLISGDGLAIKADLGDSSSLIFNGTTIFEGCRAMGGNGGALYVTLSTGSLKIGESGSVSFKK